MYACTSFRGEKTSKMEKKGVLLVMVINFGKKDGRKLRKKYAKTHIGSIFMPGKYVIRVYKRPFLKMKGQLPFFFAILYLICLAL